MTVIKNRELRYLGSGYTNEQNQVMPKISKRLLPVSMFLRCQNLCLDAQLTAAAFWDNRRMFAGRKVMAYQTRSNSN